jgi:hypothetical protein
MRRPGALAAMLVTLVCFAEVRAGMQEIKRSDQAEGHALWKFDTHG